MRHEERRDRQVGAQGNGIAVRQLPDFNVFESHELVPWPVRRQVVPQTGHRKYRHAVRAGRFAPEVHETGVMAHMRMRQEHTIERVVRVGSHPVQVVQLFAHVRRGIEQVLPAVLSIDDGDGRGPAPQGRVFPRALAVRPIAVGLRIAGILGDAEHFDKHFFGHREHRQQQQHKQGTPGNHARITGTKFIDVNVLPDGSFR